METFSIMSKSDKGSVTVKFSIGFGNNIFQYVFSRLLAEYHGLTFNHPALVPFGIKEQYTPSNKSLKTVKIGVAHKTGAYDKYFRDKTPDVNYNVRGYFEDYTIYQNHLDYIRSWFPIVLKKNTTDLIVHIRLQNRLVQLNHYMNFISGEAYAKAIESFDFNRIHIVTDAEKWGYYTHDDVKKIQKDILEGPNPGALWVPIQDSLNYMKELVDAFKPYDPIIHRTNSPTIKGSGGLRGNFMDAFNLLRSFDQVLLYNSTFSWWGAVLGNASKVGVFSLWKPGREDKNPNLGQTNYHGWFSWGDNNDLIRYRKGADPYYNKSWRWRMFKTHWRNRYILLKRKIASR
jgi:hypothetical protein